jgi:penicillin-binding protein 1A
MNDMHADKRSPDREPPRAPRRHHWLLRSLWLTVLGLGTLGVGAVIAVLIALAIAYPSIPDVSSLAHYRPKQPLRVYTSDDQLIGEFGQERRNLTPIDQIPQVMKNAVLAAEDARFYEHGGVDYLGVIRAALANLAKRKSQGASTITMQVARNVYLSSEKTYTRKIYELLLSLKLEHSLTKDQILEIYMNQIFLGNRSYGFATAAETYFGKPLQDLDIAQAAMLAGIPKSPSTANPIANFARAKKRQLYVIDRMVDSGFITPDQGRQAAAEKLTIRKGNDNQTVHGQYIAEMVRQIVFAQYGDDAYSRGLNVYTSIDSADQAAASAALRNGILDYSARQAYRGPEKFIDLPKDPAERNDAIDEALADIPDIGEMEAAVVLSADPHKITAAVNDSSQIIEITGTTTGLRAVWSGLQKSAAPNIKLRPGAIIRVIHKDNDQWETAQLPEVEGAFVALDPNTGAIKALVGGFDFNQNEFNHVTQAWRQPGSSFKPFIYSAALHKGLSPATIIDDAPLYFGSDVTGGKPWIPKNYGGGFEGPMTMQEGLARSRNLIAIRVLQAVTPRFAQGWAERFGFDPSRQPPYLTMALGAGTVTPLQMVAAYGVFANGGHRVNPYLITRITDQSGKVLLQTEPTLPSESDRVISARNAFVMDSMLQAVTRNGTAAQAQAQLKRPDLFGKTGTTNDSLDSWFVGFQPSSLVAAVWMGYDTPRTLGARATGGGLALPIWINFMRTALKGVPVTTLKPPDGVTNVGGLWAYNEYANGGGVASLSDSPGSEPPPDEVAGSGAAPAPASPDERSRILNMFRN